MKILVAGPGTGKTTKIKKVIDDEYSTAENILVLSFTNATINDLQLSFKDYDNVECRTLHSFAFKVNPKQELHVLEEIEVEQLKILSRHLRVHFDDLCKVLGCITYDNMIKECVRFIDGNPTYSKEVVGELDLLLVDEYQDFNENERELIQRFASLADDCIILGDDDQSIYDFKHADPQGIINLHADADVEKIAHENICYRCPDEIVEACGHLISKNKLRIDKEWKKSGKDGELIVEQLKFLSEVDTRLINLIEEIRSDDSEASFLVLSPAGFAVESTKKALKDKGIDFNDLWSISLDEGLVFKIWWVRALLGYKPLLNLIFIVCSLRILNRKGIMDPIKLALYKGEDEEKVIKFLIDSKLIKSPYREDILQQLSIEDLKNKHTELADILDELNELELQKGLKDLLQRFKGENSFDDKVINFMSIHKSKGLQADYVFILGLVEGILPNKARGIDTIEAQRRRLFVGVSRAKKRCYIIANVFWPGKYVNRVDKAKFKYNPTYKLHAGKISDFVNEMKNG